MSNLKSKYTKRYEKFLLPASAKLKEFLEELFLGNDNICWISVRPKSIKRFLAKTKAKLGEDQKYSDPMNEIQDQLGALITVRYLSDVKIIQDKVDQFISGIERQFIEPKSASEFGYIGYHFIKFLPTDITANIDSDDGPDFFELQIKTLFQYAWSETNHKIGYERHQELTEEQKKMTAYIAAQAWGADRSIEELNNQLNNGTPDV